MTKFNPSEDQVAEWLGQHPDFFCRHADLLGQLQIPHSTGTASLIERQVAVLRADNDELCRRLDHLSGVAGENERLLRRLHRVGLQIVASDSLSDMFQNLDQALRDEFDADGVRLLIKTSFVDEFGSDSVTALDEGTQPKWLRDLLRQGIPRCGRLTGAKRETVFGSDGTELGSVALVPVAGFGLLAIGSLDDDRFQPDMGTLFLEQLGQTVRFRLEHAAREREAQAASA